MPFVLDCSMTMAWVFWDEATAATDAVRDRLATDTAVVPCLWPLEVGNVLLAATRRQRLKLDEWPRLTANLSALPITVDEEAHRRVFAAVLPLAHEHGLTVYDAVYLELALRTRLPLATLDQTLARACDKAGVPVL